MKRRLAVLLVLAMLLLCGCTARTPAETPRICHIVLEASDAFDADPWMAAVAVGTDAVFTITPKPGWMLTGADHADALLTTAEDGGSMQLTVPQVRYSAVVAISAERTDRSIVYEANGGMRTDGSVGPVEIPDNGKHLRPNTATDLFIRPGYTQIGWRRTRDESNELIGLGSRVTVASGKRLTLYAAWAEWTDSACFTREKSGSGMVVTGYAGQAETIVIPAELDGLPVMEIASGAFAGTDCKAVVLPLSLRRIADGAFTGCTLQTLTLFDTLQTVHDGAFADCASLRTLRIQAAAAPVYSGTYYATFADKMDRLLALRDTRKMVLFSGSSTRFGYDSAAIDAAFPDYDVANMGVFAYTNAVPQLLLILDCMQAGDVLVDSPELDAAKRQFCTTNRMDAPFFRMIEADYDLLARLDLREVSGTFSAYNEYRAGRTDLPARGYVLSPSDYDEDGIPVSTPSYNVYGDYIRYRPDAPEDSPIYGLAVPYTVAAYPYDQYMAPYNDMCRRFMDKGVRVFFTWSPRNRAAVSDGSTPEAMAALEEYVRESIIVPMLLPLEESMVPGRLLFGTDNHLSTNGCALRTARIIEALTRALEVSE